MSRLSHTFGCGSLMLAGTLDTAPGSTGLLIVSGGNEIRSGAFGFNCVLVAIALGGGLFVLNAASAAYTTLAVVATAVVFAALSAALEPLGMPALTSPFVLVTWVCLWASAAFPALRRAGDFKSTSTTSGAAD